MAKAMSKANSKSVVKENTKMVTKEIVTEDVKDNTDETIVEKKETIKKDTVKKFKDDDLIPVRSITTGKLVMPTKNGNVYRWMNYGDTEYVAYKDLRVIAQNTTPSSYVYNPRFIIEDEDFINEFPKVRDFYNSLYTTKDLRDILNLPINEMKKIVNELPSGCKESLKSLAATMIRDGSLDSVKKIKLLDEVFETQLFLTVSEE